MPGATVRLDSTASAAAATQATQVRLRRYAHEPEGAGPVSAAGASAGGAAGGTSSTNSIVTVNRESGLETIGTAVGTRGARTGAGW